MNYTNYLRWGAISGLFLTLVIPFVISTSMFFPFITGKNFLFRILVEVLFGVWVMLALKDPAYRPRFSWLFAALVLFVAWMGVATFFSIDPVKSFWSNFERMEGYLTVLHLLAYFIAAFAILHAQKLWTRFFEYSVIASAAMGVYAICQAVGIIPVDQGGVRLDGTLGNATYFAVYLLFNIFLALLLLWREPQMFTIRDARIKTGLGFIGTAAALAVFVGLAKVAGSSVPYMLLIGVLLMAVVGAALLYARERAYFAGFVSFVLALDIANLFLTESRGPILGMLGGLVVAALCLWLFTRHTGEWQKSRAVGVWAVGALVALGLIFMAVRDTSFVRQIPGISRIASISLADATTQSRFLIWNMSWQGFLERPVTGWGQENFSYVFNKYYNPRMYAQEQWFDRTHNSFLDWLIAGGLPAFLLYVSLFVLATLALWRARALSAPDRAILLGLLSAYAFHSVFVFDNLVSSMYFFTILALAHALSQREVPSYLWLSRPVGERGMAIAAPIVAVVFLGGAWALNAPGIANATGIIGAISTTNPITGAAKNPADNLAYFKTVLSGSPLGRQETVEQLMQFAASVGASQSMSPEIKQQFYTTAYDAMTEMTKERPGDARLELFFGSFLNQFGQQAEALEHLEKAAAASPQKQAILFEMGVNNYLRAKDYPNALAVLKKAFDLAPEYTTARVYYAIALYESGQTAAADQLLVDKWGTITPLDSDTLLQAYYSIGLYSRAAAIVEARIVKSPADAQLYLTLAAVRYQMGDKAGAIAALQAGAKASPDFAAQAQALITQIEQSK